MVGVQGWRDQRGEGLSGSVASVGFRGEVKGGRESRGERSQGG